jgi:CheY-like chemotaxis protein
MQTDTVILISEDDLGHGNLVEKILRRAGLSNDIKRFFNGEEILNFLFRKGDGEHRTNNTNYVLVLDIQMPKINGIDVLHRIKEDISLKILPVVMLTTTDNPTEIKKCYDLGCNNYVTKPVDYDDFVNVVKQMGLFLASVKVPTIIDS